MPPFFVASWNGFEFIKCRRARKNFLKVLNLARACIARRVPGVPTYPLPFWIRSLTVMPWFDDVLIDHYQVCLADGQGGL